MKVMRPIGLVLALVLSALTGCQGGGSSTQPTSISGMVSKGPIAAGTVVAYAVRNGIEDRSTPIGQGKTDNSGNYTLDLGQYTGPIVVEATNGSYKDEVTGATVVLKTPLRAVLSNAAGGTNSAAITPLTELAYKKARGSNGVLTAASIDDANAKVASFFQLNNVITTVPDAAGSSDDQKKYAAVLGSIAQYVNNNKNQGESLDDAVRRLLVSMGDEVENAGGFSIGTINGINTAISNFNNSGRNTTGVAIAPLSLPTSGLLKLSSSGTATIAAIDVVVNFPAGVSVLADAASGETAAGAVAVSGAAIGGNTLSTAKFIPASGGAPSSLHIAVISPTGFGPGEFATIKFSLDTGGSFPSSASMFSVAGFSAAGLNGSTLNGLTASAASVAGEL